MVYFVQSVNGGPIKIGYSADVRKRMFSLRSSNPEPVILLGVMEGDLQTEREVQAFFDRVRGEWFEATPQLLEFIRLNCDEELRLQIAV